MSFDSPLKMFNRMLKHMGFVGAEEDLSLPEDDSLFAPPMLPMSPKQAAVGKPMVQFWSADQVQIDSRGIRIRHSDSNHPDAVETVIKPSAADGPGVRNIALPPPKQIAHEIPMPKGPPLAAGRHIDSKLVGLELEKRAILPQQVVGTQVNVEAVDEAPIRGTESDDSWVTCWRRFTQRHRSCRHRWIAHIFFGLLFGISSFFLCYHLARRQRRHHHKHRGEKAEGNATYVIALPPSYDELYSSDKKPLLGADVVVAVAVPEGTKVTDEDKKALLAAP